MKKIQRWARAPSRSMILVLMAAALMFGAHRLYNAWTMPPVFVYLIPHNFVGPVFVFFGQKDGVESEPDPLGQAVRVPENGVVKLRGRADELIRSSSTNQRAEAHVMIQQDGSRRILKTFTGPHPSEDGESFWEGYMDESDKLHKYAVDYINNNKPPKLKQFHYFSSQQLSERMIFNQSGCRHQGFVREVRRLAAGEADADALGVPTCGKFLVASPGEILTLPDWMWSDTERMYRSIDEFVVEANERVQTKRDFYQ